MLYNCDNFNIAVILHLACLTEGASHNETNKRIKFSVKFVTCISKKYSLTFVYNIKLVQMENFPPLVVGKAWYEKTPCMQSIMTVQSTELSLYTLFFQLSLYIFILFIV